MSEINCNGCRACCIKDAQSLLPHEVGKYYTEIFNGMIVLAHKPNGECFYLGENGCTIHDWKPQKCREFNCVELLKIAGERTMKKFCSAEVLAAAIKRKGEE